MQLSFRLVVAALVASLAVTLALMGWVGTATGEARVFVCVKKKGGQMRMVAKRTKCRKAERKRSFAQRGARGRRGARGVGGPQGPAGPQGPQGAQGGAGSGLNLNFNAVLSAGDKKEVTIGAFNVTAAAQTSGTCEPIRLRTTTNSRIAIGSGNKFTTLGEASVISLTSGENSNMFTVVTLDGRRTMSGILGSTTIGNVCVVSGYVTGV